MGQESNKGMNMKNPIKTETIWEALKIAVNEMKDSTMYIYEGRQISYNEVDEISDRLATGLLKLGFQKGDKIGIIGLNQPECLYTYFAAAKIGVAITGLSVRYRDSELDYMINQSKTRAILSLTSLFDMDYVNFFDNFKKTIPSVKEYIFMGGQGFDGSISFETLIKTEIDRELIDRANNEVTPDDTILIIYTSGTTGRPKGTVITHKSQLASAYAQAVHIKISPDDMMSLALPLNHVGGITCGVLTALLGKSKILLIPMFSPDYVIEQMKKFKLTIATGVPTIHTLLLMNEKFKEIDTSAIRLVVSGGSNSDTTLLTQLHEAYPNAVVMNLYGLSETSGMVVMSPWESSFDYTLKSIGKPVGDLELKIIDEKNNIVGTDVVGQICFKGDQVIKEYLDMPEATKNGFDKEGWVLTGDMGCIDENGYIILMGRKKEMYIQGGFNVYPVEVENLITSHPKVAMAAGIGIPDKILGEVGKYYIVPAPGAEINEKEIIEFCKEHLADYKIPRKIEFRKELPMTPAGKIQKAALKED